MDAECTVTQLDRVGDVRVSGVRGRSQESPAVDLPRSFTIRESSHRIHHPLTGERLAVLGRALGARVLALACGWGEMPYTWARVHGITGTGVDISTVFIARARALSLGLGAADRAGFVHGDAAGHVAGEPVDAAACVGATWIGGGVSERRPRTGF